MVAEVPCVEKEDIRLYACKDGLTINLGIPQRKDQRELPLPSEVDPKPAKTSYKNAALAVRFKKKGKLEKIHIK